MRVLPWFSVKTLSTGGPARPSPARGVGFERLTYISETTQPIEKRSSLASNIILSTPYLTSAVSNRSHHGTLACHVEGLQNCLIDCSLELTYSILLKPECAYVSRSAFVFRARSFTAIGVLLVMSIHKGTQGYGFGLGLNQASWVRI